MKKISIALFFFVSLCRASAPTPASVGVPPVAASSNGTLDFLHLDSSGNVLAMSGETLGSAPTPASLGFPPICVGPSPSYPLLFLPIDNNGNLLVDVVNGGGGSGTVTSVSVASANGLSGTVSNPTTTPAITLSTTLSSGVIPKSNGTGLVPAVAGTDYLSSIPLGNLIIVDAVNGNDSTGAVHVLNKPYLTLGAAKTASTSGDTIYVRPGTYTPTANLLKNGVNWYFCPGATVTASGTWSGGIFDDSSYGANSACTCVIGGEGVFNYNPSDVTAIDDAAFDSTGIVSVTNAASIIWFRASKITTNFIATSTLFTNNGTLYANVDYSFTSTGYGLWWDNGDFYYFGHRIEGQDSSPITTDCTVAGTPSGKFWVSCDTIAATGSATTTPISVQDTNANAAVWIFAKEINSAAATPATCILFYNLYSGKLYITAQKIISNSSNASTPVFNCTSSGGQLWFNIEKLTTGGGGFFNVTNGGSGSGPTIYASVQHFESLATVSNGIKVAQGSLTLSGNDGVLTANTGLLQTGGTFTGCNLILDSSANSGGFPIYLSGTGSMTTNLGSDYLKSNGSSDSVHATSAHTVSMLGSLEVNNPVNSNISFSSDSQVGLKVNGVTASGSMPNDFSGSTGTFKASSGVTTLPNLTSNGHVQTTGGGGQLSVDTTAYAPSSTTPVVNFGRLSAGQTGAVASVEAITVGASDSSYIVSANINVTAVTAASFTCTCTYTDETNTSRTLTLSFSNLAGTPLQTITQVTGTGAYEGAPLHIRAKAGTTITIATTGTFTTVTYNVEGIIELKHLG